MDSMQILHDVYKRSYSDFKANEGYKSVDFVLSNIEEFTEIVLQDWCGDVFSTLKCNGNVVNHDSEMVFQIRALHNKRALNGHVSYMPIKTKLGFMSNGDLVTFDEESKKSGQTYTGDRYIDSYSTTYTVKQVLYSSELFQEFCQLSDVTSEQIESIAVELSQEILDLHESESFHS